MHYTDQWKALSARIRGLVEAAEFDHRLFGKDNTGNWRFLGLQAGEVVNALTELKASLENARHATAASALDRVLAHNTIKGVQTISEWGDHSAQIVRSCFVTLRAFEAEMTFLLSDAQTPRRLTPLSRWTGQLARSAAALRAKNTSCSSGLMVTKERRGFCV
jgi:hypothetical protein